MSYEKVLEILQRAKYLYEEKQTPIVTVFTLATEELQAKEFEKQEAVRYYVWGLPQPERVMRIEEMVVCDLIEGFKKAIQLVEERQNA